MKIEIEWSSSYEANMKIDGKSCSVQLRSGAWKLEGLTDDEIDTTVGGFIASDLFDKVCDWMQGEARAAEVDDPNDETWTAFTPLSDEAIDAYND